METNDSNLKPQQTGGLKLMTVFIAVLALHVIVIGGFTVYHLLSSSSTDQDMVLDKNHKGVKVLPDGSLAGDVPSPDTSSTDKTASATTPPADTTSTAAPTAPADTASTTPVTTPAPVTPPPPDTETASTASAPTSQTPSGPIQHGPVIDPPENMAPAAPAATDTASTPAVDDSAAPVTDGASYTVKRGDSLARIARQHHVALAKLKAANSLANNLLHIGQKLVIPNRATTVASTTADADTVAVPADVTAPPMPSPSHKAGKSMSNEHHLYTVVKGDTLIKIARRFKTTPSAIMTANNLTDAARLSIGKKLRIPAGESRSAAASVPVSSPAATEDAKPGPKGQLANFTPEN